MKARLISILGLVTCVTLLLALLPGEAAPAAARGPEPPGPGKPFASEPTRIGPYQTPEGLWVMPDGATPLLEAASVSPQATGGPDDYGYVWDDNVPFSWIDATSGTSTGMTGTNQQIGPIPLPFSFKYYENTYNQVYVSTNGTLGFSGQLTDRSQGWEFPEPASPNNVIAPYWAPEDASTGGVYYTSGGDAPNRWWAAEWYQVRDFSADSRLTFEVVLFENGNLEFRYQTINRGSSSYGYSVGIEDSAGLDGLKYAGSPGNSLAVHFYRPAPSARVGIRPLYPGRFTRAGATESFQVPIRNTGDLGADIYDLVTSSSWPVALYAADGITPLTDTEGDSTVDTGAVVQGGTVTITVKVQTPAAAGVGDSNTASVTVSSSLDTGESKIVTLQTAVPAPFVLAYYDYDPTGGETGLYLVLVQPAAQAVKKVGWYGDHTAVAEALNSNLVYAWDSPECTESNCFSSLGYTLLNKYGDTVRGESNLTNNSGAVTNYAVNHDMNMSPAVAVAPNGRIGILWYHYTDQYINNTYQYNYNLYFAILDAAGDRVYGPLNLTNNTAVGDPRSDPNVPKFQAPRIAATSDNRFVLAWQRSAGWVTDIYCAVRDSSGAEVRGITRFTYDTPNGDEAYYNPSLTRLSGSRTLLAWTRDSDKDIYYAVLDSSSNVVKATTNLVGDGTSQGDWRPDAVQLSDGKIVVAWTGGSYHDYRIRFAVLDTSYNRIAGPITLSNPAASPDDDLISVAADATGHAILTWMGYDYQNHHNLYYALVDGNGNVLTPPMLLRPAGVSSWEDQLIITSNEGYGNTSYSWTPLAGVDGVAAFASSLFGAPPGSNAEVGLRYANHGATMATGAVLTATLDSNLTYVNDTSGITPTVNGNDVVWSLPDLDFLADGRFTLYVGVPAGADYGTRYPVALTLTSAGSEANPGDNTATAQVMVARQVFLPLVLRNY